MPVKIVTKIQSKDTNQTREGMFQHGVLMNTFEGAGDVEMWKDLQTGAEYSAKEWEGVE